MFEMEKEMKKICKNCDYWERSKCGNSPRILYYGTCGSGKWTYREDHECDVDGVQYWDYEGYAAGFETGENFGCRHWSEKCQNQK